MSPEFPVVRYAPQSNEAGWVPGEVALLPAAIVKLTHGSVADLDVRGPDGTYRVSNVPVAAEPIPGTFVLPSDVAGLIAPQVEEHSTLGDDEEEEAR